MGVVMIIRREREADVEQIRVLNEAAFGRSAEAHLVDVLRINGKVALSLVGVADGQVIAHALWTPGAIGDWPCVALGPVGVLPDYQKQGWGSAVIEAGHLQLRALGHARTMVLGHADYYPRFGFKRATQFGIANPFGADDAFMVMALQPNGLADVVGMAAYQPEFTHV